MRQKWKKTTVKNFALRRHRSIEKYAREDSELVNQDATIV